MANPARRLAHNAPGPVFVDASCIDCDTCRWMAPATFARRQEQATVARQPATDDERRRAAMALLSCPTGSIGGVVAADVAAGERSLPERIDGSVYHCGYHHEASFGAASYLLVRADGNVLVDSPRFTRRLVRRIEEMGGVRWLFLTHKDDVADHRAFRDHFRCERVLHERDLGRGTRDVERPLAGDDPVALAEDLLVIPTPGHTEGSACLLFAGRYLFTGDHLAFSERLGQPYAFRDACWHDWDVQVESMRRLAAFDFEWILPGHGRRCRFAGGSMRSQMARTIAWMESVAREAVAG